jgi:hypothetical protein
MNKKIFLVFLMPAFIVAVSPQAIADCGSGCASSCSGVTGKDYEECIHDCINDCLDNDPPPVPDVPAPTQAKPGS